MPLFTDERNSKFTSVVNFISSKFGSLPQRVLKVRITKPCTHLHPAPSAYTQLISTSTQPHPPPPSLFQSPPSSLQHPKQYSNQNITRNWAISPNLGRKIQSCPFWLKIDSQGMLEVLILNPDPQNPFLGKFGLKKWKFSVLSENWHTWYLKDADSYSNISFLKFQP